MKLKNDVIKEINENNENNEYNINEIKNEVKPKFVRKGKIILL